MDYRRLGRFANGCYQEILHMLCVKPSVDALQDDSIYCLKKGQPCCTGREMLRSQLDILDEPYLNPFQCNEFTSSDIEEAYPAMVTMQQLDSDHEEDSDIDIL